MYSICFKFIICVGLIFFAGKKVALYADIIAEKMAAQPAVVTSQEVEGSKR